MSIKIKRALISVSDKVGILEFASALQQLGVEILSTGGTFKYLADNGVLVTEVANITKFPEILGGRVKTLHPNIHGAILAKRDDNQHIKQLEQHDITPIDLVCVNLYPFEATIAKLDCTLSDAIENIDIGGPAMIRASSKNYKHVVIVTNPNDYSKIIDELKNSGDVNGQTRLVLAQTAFSHTAYYDSLISGYLAKQQDSGEIDFYNEFTIPARLVQKLRYGENSHQTAAFYRDSGDISGLLASFKQLQGKELSYNNLADADTAWECVKQFDQAACVIVKHANPCGVAIADNILASYKKAFSSDPVSSFGGIIAFNKLVDADVATAVSGQFMEVLLAPEYTPDALEILAKKSNVRVLQIKLTKNHNQLDYKRIGGGLLIQTPENKQLNKNELQVVTKLQPDNQVLNDLEFAWAIARFVKSNAIILVKDGQTIGIGAGQMSRIDSSKIAMNKAREFGFDTVGAVCASDAFFPFRDNVDLLAGNGAKAIIHPGGSIKDAEVFAAADELNIVMVLTKYRTFRH